MKAAIKITKNTIALTIRDVLNKGSIFILLVLIGRFLGKDALGRYSLAFVISQIFFFGTDLGLNILVIREVAKDRSSAEKTLVNLGLVRVLTGLITFALIWITVGALKAKGETAAAIYLCALSYFFVNLITLYASIFRAFEKMELDLLTAVIKSAIFLPLAVWLLFNRFGLIPIFNLFLVSNILTLIAAHMIFKKVIGPLRSKLDLGFCKNQLKETSSLWVAQLFSIAYLKLAPILLFRLKGEGAVGLYNAGFIVLDGFLVVSSCYACALFPIISNLVHGSMPEAAREYLKGLRLLAVVFTALGAFFVLAASRIVPFFYGQIFTEIVPLFRLLTIAAVLVALDTHNNLTIIAIGRQSSLPFINMAAFLINLIFNVLFITRFGYVGSAYAMIITESLMFVFMVAVLKRHLLTPQRQAL